MKFHFIGEIGIGRKNGRERKKEGIGEENEEKERKSVKRVIFKVGRKMSVDRSNGNSHLGPDPRFWGLFFDLPNLVGNLSV